MPPGKEYYPEKARIRFDRLQDESGFDNIPIILYSIYMETEKNDNASHISWHPAFIEALQMELMDYENELEFHPEYQLTAEPLRIDCVIIKKAKDVVIKKNIAQIFREVNLIEYKSPDDYVSVEDFYKVYGYACVYASLEKTPIKILTISFVESSFPKKLITHLKEERGYSVAKSFPGVYTISGDILPIQIIDSRQLSAEENLWLKSLSNKLDSSAVLKITKEAERQEKAARIHAYMDAIARANILAIKEVANMSETTLTLEKVLEEAGITARVEARAEARGKEQEAITIAKNMADLGLPFETIVTATQLSPEKVEALFK